MTPLEAIRFEKQWQEQTDELQGLYEWLLWQAHEEEVNGKYNEGHIYRKNADMVKRESLMI